MTAPVATVSVAHTDQYLICCIARVDIPEHGIVAGQVFFLRRIRKGFYEIRTLTILQRTPRQQSISFQVKNGDEKVYHPTLNRNSPHTCDCEAGSHGRCCYHVTFVRLTENARILADQATRVPQTDEEMQAMMKKYNTSRSTEIRNAIISVIRPLCCEHGYFQIAGHWYCFPGETIYCVGGSPECCDLGKKGALGGNQGFSLLRKAA